MHRLLALLLLVSCSLSLAACGGGDDDDKRDTKRSSDTTRELSRPGYFGEEQSKAINPALADWNEATNAYYSGYDACNAEAQKRFKDGATAAKSVECHLRDTKAVIVAIQGVRDATTKLDGEWRDACDDELAEFTTFLDEHEAAWNALQADWAAYAAGKPTPKINAHSAAADTTYTAFVEDAVPSVTKQCYTKESRAAAEKEAKDASHATPPTADSGDGDDATE